MAMDCQQARLEQTSNKIHIDGYVQLLCHFPSDLFCTVQFSRPQGRLFNVIRRIAWLEVIHCQHSLLYGLWRYAVPHPSQIFALEANLSIHSQTSSWLYSYSWDSKWIPSSYRILHNRIRPINTGRRNFGEKDAFLYFNDLDVCEKLGINRWALRLWVSM